MSQSASPRNKIVFVVVAALAVAGIGAFAVSRIGGDDTAEPLATSTSRPTTTAAPSTTTPTPTETTSSPTETPEAECEGPDTLFNLEGEEKTTLLPDCGVAPVTEMEQQTNGLSLACGGSYPVILYKTTTAGAKTSICGRDASGADFRFVTQPTDGKVLDLMGRYEPDLDAFVAKDGTTTYQVLAYDGTLVVKGDGGTKKQKSSDWISLDNEPDLP